MTEKNDITCILCPLGCRVAVTLHPQGDGLRATGGKCKLGREYAIREYRSPVRVLTATVLVKSGPRRLLPVRSDKPIPKARLKECMVHLARATATPPVRTGQIVVPNIAGTGANLIATDDVPF